MRNRKENRKARISTRFMAIIMAFAMILCVVPPQTVNAAASLSVKKATLDVGEKLKITVKNPTATVKWSSSKSSVVRISTTGGAKNKTATIKAVKAGSAKVYAKMGSKKLTATIKVVGDTNENCSHVWLPATCQQPETCSKCGTTRGTVRDHSYDSNGECMWCSAKDLNESLTIFVYHTAPFGFRNTRWIQMEIRNRGTENFEILTSRGATVYTEDTGSVGMTVHLTDADDLEYNERMPFRVDIGGISDNAFYDTQSDSMLFTFTMNSRLEFYARYGEKIYKIVAKTSVPNADGTTMQRQKFQFTEVR